MDHRRQLVEELQKAVGLTPEEKKPKEYVYEQYNVNNHRCGRMTEIKRLKPIALKEENIIMEAFIKLLCENKNIVTTSECAYISSLYQKYSNDRYLFAQSVLYHIVHECMDTNIRMINGSTEQGLLVRNTVDKIVSAYKDTGET